MKTVAQKMGIKKDSRGLFVNAPTEAISGMKLPEMELKIKLAGEFDFIHLFAKNQVEVKEKFPVLKAHLKLDGMLWISWPKGGQLDTDISLPKLIRVGYGFGLVESTCLSVNSVWSALKFTHPKKGKLYKNSHAKLTSRTTNR